MKKMKTKKGLMAGIVLAAAAVIGLTAATNPYLKPDGSWISISGTAVDVQMESFTLDYGEGTVLVEMDDWDWYREDETRLMMDGDKVRVYGRVDDDLYETTSIEASSVYVEPLGTYYYASAVDEEGGPAEVDVWVDATPIVIGETTIRGTVTGIQGREFTVDTGTRAVSVDTIGMGYNPLDDKGYVQIDEGDYVSVTGDIDVSLWDERELSADTVVTLVED